MSQQDFRIILLSTSFLLLFCLLFSPQKQKPIKPESNFKAILSFNHLQPETKVILVGDIMLGRTVMTKSLGLGDPTYPFEKVGQKLKLADIVFANLENPIVENCPSSSSGMIFCADPKMVQGLVFTGVDIVTLANNHTLNYGQGGLQQTQKYLGQAGVLVTGLDNLVIKRTNQTNFGFLGFNFVDQLPTEADYQLVFESDAQVDVLIVGVHWGSEYHSQASQTQRQIALKLVENGADVVVGHHPHWVQESEKIYNKPVFYSLGNFVFDQMWSSQTREGILVELTFQDSELIQQQTYPVYMSSWAQPEFKLD